MAVTSSSFPTDCDSHEPIERSPQRLPSSNKRNYGTMVFSSDKSSQSDDQSPVPVGADPKALTTVTTTASVADGTDSDQVSRGLHLIEGRSTRWWSYLTTRNFWLLILLGQVLSMCIVGTSTFTTFLSTNNNNVPAFQTLFNYIVIFIIWFTVFIVKDGFVGFWNVIKKDWWKYAIMSFLDVEGNYFTVLAFRYTNVLSTQLISFWSIVCVVIISFTLLKVRYKWVQIAGILICCGGMGMLMGSDYLKCKDSDDQSSCGTGGGDNRLKGDLFCLLGATLYGTSNVLEEWLVSKAPMYHVLTFIGMFGMIINGAQAGIFDRESFQSATWDSQIAGWMVGYTICLALFYSLAPLMLRMGSAAVFDVSILTANFWIAIIGIRVFHISIHYLYPVAFVLIIVGIFVYFLSGSLLGDSKKPWLGENQENGFAGVGTAKLQAINAVRVTEGEPENGFIIAGRRVRVPQWFPFR